MEIISLTKFLKLTGIKRYDFNQLKLLRSKPFPKGPGDDKIIYEELIY